MTIDGGTMIGMVVVLALGGALGYFACLVNIARDSTLIRMPPESLIVKREVFEKLQSIAEVKHKNPRLKFDSRGVPTGVRQDDDDDDVV